MPAYLGKPGLLVPVKCRAVETSAEDRFSFETTLEGRRKAQYRAGAPRSWAVEMGLSTAQQAAGIRALAEGEFGPGPFVWVTDEAQVTNMLTAAQSTCDKSTLYTAGVIAGGPLNLGAEGVAGRSFLNPDPATTFRFGGQGTPVLPGQKVTASAYLVGDGAKIQIRWEDAAGGYLSTSTSGAQGTAGVPVRAYLTSTAPANAAFAYINALSTSQGARPAITWTDTLTPWTTGQGCPKAVVSGLAGNPVVLTARARSAISFMITEVG